MERWGQRRGGLAGALGYLTGAYVAALHAASDAYKQELKGKPGWIGSPQGLFEDYWRHFFRWTDLILNTVFGGLIWFVYAVMPARVPTILVGRILDQFNATWVIAYLGGAFNMLTDLSVKLGLTAVNYGYDAFYSQVLDALIYNQQFSINAILSNTVASLANIITAPLGPGAFNSFVRIFIYTSVNTFVYFAGGGGQSQ